MATKIIRIQRKAITGLDQGTRELIRLSVGMAMDWWPNSHLGEYSTREDMRSAFEFLRNNIERTGDVWGAAYLLQQDAFTYADM